jgi:hypothetical protein
VFFLKSLVFILVLSFGTCLFPGKKKAATGSFLCGTATKISGSG